MGRYLCAGLQVVSKPAPFQELVFLGDFLPAFSVVEGPFLPCFTHFSCKSTKVSTVTQVVAGAQALEAHADAQWAGGARDAATAHMSTSEPSDLGCSVLCESEVLSVHERLEFDDPADLWRKRYLQHESWPHLRLKSRQARGFERSVRTSTSYKGFSGSSHDTQQSRFSPPLLPAFLV